MADRRKQILTLHISEGHAIFKLVRSMYQLMGMIPHGADTAILYHAMSSDQCEEAWRLIHEVNTSPLLARRGGRLAPNVLAFDWEEDFLLALSKTGIVSRACRDARVGVSTVYQKKAADAQFARRWSVAMREAVDEAEAEMRRRAIDGVVRKVYHQGQIVGTWRDASGNKVKEGTEGAKFVEETVREYSDQLLLSLLKKRHPLYREKNTLAEPVQVNVENNTNVQQVVVSKAEAGFDDYRNLFFGAQRTTLPDGAETPAGDSAGESVHPEDGGIVPDA